MKIALCCGTFDGLHDGHLDLFRQAKMLAERLVVVVARDETVVAVKGRLPIQNEFKRLSSVDNCELVDVTTLGELNDKYAIIKKIKPAIIVLGYDQQAFVDDLENVLRSNSLSCIVVRAEPFHPEIYKSSKLYARSSSIT